MGSRKCCDWSFQSIIFEAEAIDDENIYDFLTITDNASINDGCKQHIPKK
jgi:hypothetical protein